jgi:hypothetical protein
VECGGIFDAAIAFARADAVKERTERLATLSGHYQTGNKSGRRTTAEDARAKRKRVAARRRVKDYGMDA